MVHADDRRPPLHGLRVLDFSHYVSAATCGLMLADMGADVVKVERGEGDDLRRLGPLIDGSAASFQWANRNKRGLCLDLKTDQGRELARRLALQADVLIENFSTGVMARYGLGHEDLLAINPRLIYCSVSAYGRDGPHAQRPGFDPIVQAESGLISVTGPQGSSGCRVGAPVADVGAGLLAAVATLGALMARVRTGKGQHLEVSLFDSAVTLSALPMINYLASGTLPRPVGSASREGAPVDFYATADGELYIACTSDALFRRLAFAMDRPALAQDPRFATNGLRFEHREALREAMEQALRGRPRREWMAIFLREKIPCGVLNTLEDLLGADEFTSRGLLLSMRGQDGADVPGIALPFRFGATPSAPAAPAPRVGEHGQQVLADWLPAGMSSPGERP